MHCVLLIIPHDSNVYSPLAFIKRSVTNLFSFSFLSHSHSPIPTL
uniref:Uncharacterized protein n=1 Tax=Anguilla anguilla TaxID=7936 RepID=A0A0E9VX06_ANGAN